MIYGHVPRWMALENPEFDEAVTRYYSFQHGKRRAAALGEIAHMRVACELRDRDLSACPAPLEARLSVFMRQIQGALRSGSKTWFRRLTATLKKEEAFIHDMEPVEYLFEAYFFLRKRDGQGSSLPTKTEVRRMAILIRSFYDCNLQLKLARHLWGGSELTEPELSRIDKRRRWYTRADDADARQGAISNWTRHFKSAGLSALEQGKR
jgi:hypothetical protein